MNDPPAEAVVREIREEAGFETRVVKLAALYDRERHPHPPMTFHVYKVFLCEITGSGRSDGHETDDMEFSLSNDCRHCRRRAWSEARSRECLTIIRTRRNEPASTEWLDGVG